MACVYAFSNYTACFAYTYAIPIHSSMHTYTHIHTYMHQP